MSLTTQEEKIKRCKAIADDKRHQEALGRYKGWGLCCDDELKWWFRLTYDQAKDALAAHDIQLVRWSSLSCDPDDELDYALRRGVGSV